MKKNSTFIGKLLNKGNSQDVTVKVNLDMIEYLEEGIFYSYSPALDLVGYGHSESEARQSWELVLEEYLKYTLNKNTLIKDLESRGWRVARNKKTFTPPTFSWMLQNNSDLTSVYDKHDFHKTSRPVSIPVGNYA
jgi:hypothetical protein